MVNILNINLSEISNHFFSRFDFKYFYTKQYTLQIPFSLVNLPDLFDIVNGISVDTGLYTSEKTSKPFLRITELSYKFDIDDSQVIYLDDDYEIPNKNILLKNDFVLATIGATVGKINLADKHIGGTFSNNTVALRIKEDKKYLLDITFLKYLFQSYFLQRQFLGFTSQKAQPNLQSYDLENIKIPLIPYEIQQKYASKIEKIEQEIKKLKSELRPPQKIINEVFAEEFGYSKTLWKEFGKGMTAGTQQSNEKIFKTFTVNFLDFSKSKILRFSSRFHNLSTKKLMEILRKIKTLQVKNIIIEKIHRGVSPDYTSDGNIPVIKTGQLKNSYVERNENEFVSGEFHNENKQSQVKQNDILIASTGKVSLGKIDIYETDEPTVVDGHISIIRINETKYNRLFFVYFFRSVLGFFQIERDFTGATNQIELYSEQINEFLIPDITLSCQNEIVEKIKSQLDEQEQKKKAIDQKRQEIDRVIEDVLRR